MSKLDFEKPILELEAKINELHNVSSDDSLNITEEIDRMTAKVDRLLKQTYNKLTAQQKVLVARHEDRPHFKDYASQIITDFTPLAGERCFGEDQALLGGLGRFRGQSCVIMGHEKGQTTEERIKHNFGMARPEGYRKAQRLLKMAEQYQIPVITLVDTAGAYPGVGAEERGQAEAIAKSIETCLNVKVPIVSVIIGEGGSGGAIAIATADKVFMLEHSIYSVISPEGCASILWRSASHAGDAAEALRLTAQDMKELKLIDGIISEPLGGAHRKREETIDLVADTIENAFAKLMPWNTDKILKDRQEKYLAMGRAA
ncbi:MAG: acetyl-CoA carboxylase carboxyltransferase subunit alpha [Alphaproteobacteria bacterium]|jgi:acetyl-CoA carboxylase carboxyl transferase subunit alpha|nr:acetyl-CoA carboxylase carboxyltransferase subunit alpha [Alphaproteobacteria bacterium]MDP7222491.1 acetyl-CoA carboxylase carboxyltransferase subunit alpha [Alphaproteobacteria bacterium]